MHIIIVGAGLAGLSTALALANSLTKHHIVLLESASALAEIGAGVQLNPIATRLFKAWGLEPQLLAASALPKAWNLRQGSDGEILNRVPMDRFHEWYGAPYVVVHRADLHKILHEAVVAKGVEVRLNSRVQEYGIEEGWLRLVNGEELQSDLVVACDGVNSSARTQLVRALGSSMTRVEEVEETGWAAYRLMADVEDIKNDPLTKEVVDEHAANCWYVLAPVGCYIQCTDKVKGGCKQISNDVHDTWHWKAQCCPFSPGYSRHQQLDAGTVSH